MRKESYKGQAPLNPATEIKLTSVVSDCAPEKDGARDTAIWCCFPQVVRPRTVAECAPRYPPNGDNGYETHKSLVSVHYISLVCTLSYSVCAARSPWVKGKRIAKFSRSGNRIAFHPLRSFFSLRLSLSFRRKKRRYPPNEALSFLQKLPRDAISTFFDEEISVAHTPTPFFGKLYPYARRSKVAAIVSARRLAPQGIVLYCVFSPFPLGQGETHREVFVERKPHSVSSLAFFLLRQIPQSGFCKLSLSLRRKKRRYPPKQSFSFLSQRKGVPLRTKL